MQKEKLYEKVKQYKREGLEDSVVVLRLMNEEQDIQKIFDELEEYSKIEKDREWISNWSEGVEKIEKCNEYGIPMIDTDDEW